MRDLGGMVETIQSATDGAGAFQHYKTALAAYGYDNAVYSLMNDHASIGLKAFHGFVTDYPEDWIKYYIEHSYADIDAVFYGFNKSTPFFWSDAAEAQRRDPLTSERTVRLAGDALRQGAEAGIADGIGVSFCNSLGEKVGFGISRTETIGKKDMGALAEVYLLSSSFHETYMSFYSSVDVPNITDRERDVLSWSAEGKPDKEISEILGITTHTVRFHWNNIFRKLQARSKVQATMIAVKHKIVAPSKIGSTQAQK
ncbi:helix-turn-helix transcriptional regulator [Epibacterium ulvae]|uniref:helix-turn-helix transcriptional regulator n=1 Tax=Epibacterium ulvae TaxID=1156985 RepID=UPI0024900826|nr:LuxR family transcriptional regulator [Epibacterium ulvae]